MIVIFRHLLTCYQNVSVRLIAHLNSVETNLCGPGLPQLTERRRCGSFFLRDSVEPRDSLEKKIVRGKCLQYVTKMLQDGRAFK